MAKDDEFIGGYIDEMIQKEIKIEKRIFRNNGNGQRIDFEPYRQNRFEIEFPDDLDIPSYLVSTIDLPSISRGNDNGHILYSELKISLMDTIAHNLASKFFSLIRDNRSININVLSLDPTGEPTREIRLTNCYINSISTSELSYTNDGILTVELEFIVGSINY